MVPLPLVAILTIQAVLSARLLGSNTAFGDEALYLDAGRLEWAHWLHGQAIPAFQTWFSSSRAIYPPIGALANGLGGLAGAKAAVAGVHARRPPRCCGAPPRGCTASARRSWPPRCSRCSARPCTCWARSRPTTRCRCCWWRSRRGARPADAAARTPQAGSWPRRPRWRWPTRPSTPARSSTRWWCCWPCSARTPGPAASWPCAALTLLLTCLVGTLAVLLRLGGSWYLAGISQTTTERADAGTPALLVLTDSWHWTAVAVLAAMAGVVLSLAGRGPLAGPVTSSSWCWRARRCWSRPSRRASTPRCPWTSTWTSARGSRASRLAYAVDRVAGWLPSGWARPWYARSGGRGLPAQARWSPVAAAGTAQAGAMINWPGASQLIAFLRAAGQPRRAVPGRDRHACSSTTSRRRRGGSGRPRSASPGRTACCATRAAARRPTSRPSAATTSRWSCSASRRPRAWTRPSSPRCGPPGYRQIGNVPSGGPVPGSYAVWALAKSPAGRGAP